MGLYVFENQLFDHWLNQKSQEILAKMDKEKITTEEMLILTLKALTNHFYHVDIEFREEFKRIDQRFEKMDQRFVQIENKFDQRFDRLTTILMWGFGIIASSIFGLYLKLFLS